LLFEHWLVLRRAEGGLKAGGFSFPVQFNLRLRLKCWGVNVIAKRRCRVLQPTAYSLDAICPFAIIQTSGLQALILFQAR
jgi:hypothetical protein